MERNEGGMSEGLLRQRRNLLAMSLVLLLFDVAGASFKTVMVLGSELAVVRQGILPIAAWIVWAYWLLRYTQYLKAEGNLGIKEAIDGRMVSYVRHRLTLEPWRGPAGEVHYWVLERPSRWRWALALEHYKPATSDIGAHRYNLSFVDGWWLRLRAHMAIAATTPKYTDYVLPFVVAAAAALTAIGFKLAAA
jgi:hypothetical protein